MPSDPPVVSVLLPAYNGAEHLPAAIESVLSQSYRDLELVIVDDASTDETWQIISTFHDHRITSIRHSDNAGLVGALTTGLVSCRGRLIARHDQDDVSLPSRIERQVDFLRRNPGTAMVGTWARVVPQGREGARRAPRLHHPAGEPEISWMLLWNNPFVHGSVMIRRSVLDAVGGYSTDPQVTPPEDYDLWSRLAQTHTTANIPEELVVYRQSPGGMSNSRRAEIEEKAELIASRNIQQLLGSADPERLKEAIRTMNGAVSHSASFWTYFSVDELLVRAAFRLRERRGKLPVRSLLVGLGRSHKTQFRHAIGHGR